MWLILAFPAGAFLVQLILANGRIVEGAEVIHVTGELSAWLLIAALLASPLALILRGWRGPRWMLKNRRYLGVASFGYGALHALTYLLDRRAFTDVVSELDRLEIWSGWVSFAILLPLAVTSSDYVVRRLGAVWKTLQRSVYVAAGFTALHWASFEEWGGIAPTVLFFGPLLAFEGYRLWLLNSRPVGRLHSHDRSGGR
ncbi:ferric reductase-like transmembrane domain-containing protein [Roseovarius sp. THAF27]|uniref:ferric reductase-like transmembrane domain-containing protein n=1 Tax=Roseovarius sp. THAF27 TaxID=2587850 RepID=UPI001C12C7B7|nr:ferric reductase-like transmembrane domain-containing protein [Roseovarius sp. THAF27]